MNQTIDYPIDVVIPWVDDSDPEWIASRAKYMGEYHESKKNLAHYFRDWDTLRYVFRSIEKNMSWVRYVHFLTCGHLPKWMNTSNPKLKIHRHSDFFAEGSALPTFSARPIEMNLMNIPDLAEHFIYFNDDTIVTSPTLPERFFQGELPIDYLVLDIPRGGWLYDHIRTKDPYAQTVKNSIKLLAEKYPLAKLYKQRKDLFFDSSYSKTDLLRNRVLPILGIFDWIKVNHFPQPFVLSFLKECYVLFKDKIDATRTHRFREYSDLNQYLYRDISLMSGRFKPRYFNDSYCFVLASKASYEENRHYLNEKTLICLNDSQFLKENEYPELRQMVIEDLETLYPQKSDFEI